MNVLCDGDACIISGTSQAMQGVLERLAPHRRNAMSVRKTTFGEIWQGLEMGGAYAFDQQAYEVFRPLAGRAGRALAEEDFSDAGPTGLHFVRVSRYDEPDRRSESQPPSDVWMDGQGLHALVPGETPSQEVLDEMTRRYQQEIRNSPLWQQMVDEFGTEQAEHLLKDFRAQVR